MARRAQVEEQSVQPAQGGGDRPQPEEPTHRAENAQQPSIPVSIPQSDERARARRLQVIQQALGEERTNASDSARQVSGGVTNASTLSSTVASQQMTQTGIEQKASSTIADIEESISFDDDFDFDEVALQQIDEAVARAGMLCTYLMSYTIVR